MPQAAGSLGRVSARPRNDAAATDATPSTNRRVALTGNMKFPEYSGGRRVSAREVRIVLDNSRPNTVRQWAEFFRVHPQTIKMWRSRGMVLDLWSCPNASLWHSLKKEALGGLWESLNVLADGNLIP